MLDRLTEPEAMAIGMLEVIFTLSELLDKPHRLWYDSYCNNTLVGVIKVHDTLFFLLFPRQQEEFFWYLQ